jgi:toxin ParE1/3/4
MKVVWSQTALTHLVGIHDYIARDSPRYAIRMIDRLTERSKQAGLHAGSGEMVPEYQQTSIREFIVGSYRLIYRIEERRAVVLAVIHGASLLPPDPPDVA